MNLLVVVGMGREARIAAGPGIGTLVAGGKTLDLPAGGAALLSFGLCGALDPALKAGDLVIGTGVIADQRIACDTSWTASLRQALPAAAHGDIVASDAPVADTAAKAALRAATGALAVDMESGWAARQGLPFAVLRAVSDAADRTLPRAALAGFGGEPDAGAVLRALLGRPWELPALIRTALEAEAGFGALVRARHLLGAGLGRPDLG